MTNRSQTIPHCPNCGRPMQPARTIPGIGGLSELRVYSCRPCGVSITEADDRREHPTSRSQLSA